MEKQIKSALEGAFKPYSLIVINDSDKHLGHAGHDGTGQTHFRVKIIAAAFTGQSRVARQRMIYDVLAPQFKAGLHALSLTALSTDEN